MCGLGGDGWAGEDEAEEGNACWLCIIWGGIHCVIVRGGGGGGSVLGRWCACWPEDGPVCVSCRSVWPSVPRRVLPWWYSVQCLCHTATAMSWVSLSAWGMHYHYVVACAAGRLRALVQSHGSLPIPLTRTGGGLLRADPCRMCGPRVPAFPGRYGVGNWRRRTGVRSA